MVARFLTPWLARLRFVAAHPPVLPLLALLFVLVAAFVQVFVLPGREAAIADGERRLATLERSARRAALERQSVVVTPENTRQRLLERFPSEAGLNAELGCLLDMAKAEGLQLASGDYRLLPAKDGLFDRYVLNLPVKGEYRKIRSYVEAVRRAYPDLAVEDITLRRENIATPEVEAQLRFVLFGRKSAA